MKGKTMKAPNTNSERFIIKNTVLGIFNRLNNYLIANDQPHRYLIEWKKGDGYLDNGYEKTRNYYKLEVTIDEGNGNFINVFGDNHPIPDGMSQLRILEAELQAYKNFLMHGVGSLISIQHGTFLQMEANRLNAEKESEELRDQQEQNQSNLIL